MKTVVSLQELVDVEIRPNELFDQYRELTRQSLATLVAGPLDAAGCQACGSLESSPVFDKLGFTYRECVRCATVFASPRPSVTALADYYRSSPAAVFWRDHVLPKTAGPRREKLAIPRAEWVADGLAEHRPHSTRGVDVSPPDALPQELLVRLMPEIQLSSFAAAAGVLPREDAGLDFVVAFDTLDRLADVPAYIAAVHAALQPGGVLFVTAPTISGFDFQVLWDRSPAILPPDKLNLLSIEGFSRLFPSTAWEMIELSTPGMFDVENVRHALAEQPQWPWPRAIRRLVAGGESAGLELQEHLQRHRLASFARMIVRRR